MIMKKELKALIVINMCLLLVNSIIFIPEQWNVIAFDLHFKSYEIIHGEVIEVTEEQGKIITYSTKVMYMYDNNMYSCYFNSLEEDSEGDVIDLIVYKKKPQWASRRNIHLLYKTSLWNIFFIASVLFLLLLFICIVYYLKEKYHSNTNNLRTRIIVAKVKRVKVIYDDCYYSKIICQYKWHIYKSRRVKGILNYKAGDKIEVKVNPLNYFNYDVLV